MREERKPDNRRMEMGFIFAIIFGLALGIIIKKIRIGILIGVVLGVLIVLSGWRTINRK